MGVSVGGDVSPPLVEAPEPFPVDPPEPLLGELGAGVVEVGVVPAGCGAGVLLAGTGGDECVRCVALRWATRR